MQTNEIVGQAKPVARHPEIDGAPTAKRRLLETQDKRLDDGGSRPVTGSKRNPRRFGAGF